MPYYRITNQLVAFNSPNNNSTQVDSNLLFYGELIIDGILLCAPVCVCVLGKSLAD